MRKILPISANFVLLLLFAAACSPAAVPAPGSTPALTPSAQIKPAQPTETRLPSTSPEAQAGPAALPTIENTPDLSRYQAEAWSDRSPEGRWQVNTIVYWPPQEDTGDSQPLFRVRVRVIEQTDSNVTELLDEWRPYGLGLELPVVLGWEADGAALFLSDRGVPDGCGASFYTGLTRVELPSFEHHEFPLDVRGKPALLPDGSRLLAFDESGLSLLSLSDGEAAPIAVELPSSGWLPGNILLSPDGAQALYTLNEDPCGAGLGWLGLVDLASGTAQTLLRSVEPALELLSWPFPELAQLQNRQGEAAWLNLPQGEIRSEPPDETAKALAALRAFFEALDGGDYAAAAAYYGGSYEVLRDNNPSVPPEDLAALWQNACGINGFQCLRLRSVVLVGAPAPGELRFRVQFAFEGEVFKLGPCCGGEIEDFPPTADFFYTVERSPNGSFQVMELPVYMP